MKNKHYGDFEAAFLKELNKHAALKKKFLRYNNNPSMTKNLRKQIMVRSKLRNDYNKKRNYQNWCKCKRQRSLYLYLLRKTKKNFYKALDEKQISDSKTLWKNVKLFFHDKGVNSLKISSIEKTKFQQMNEKLLI